MIKELIEEGAKQVASNIVFAKTAAVIDGIARNINSKDAIVDRSKAQYMLFAKMRMTTYKRGFFVTDQNQDKVYSIKTGISILGEQSIKLYDLNGKEVGRVFVEKDWVTKHKTFSIFEGNQKIGDIKRQIALGTNWDFTVGKEKVKVTGDLLSTQYKVTDADGRILISIHRAYEDRDTYVVEYFDHNHEILGLLILMAIELVHSGDQTTASSIL